MEVKRDQIIEKARYAINNRKNISRRNYKKILKPLLAVNDGEALMLLSIMPRLSSERRIDNYQIDLLKRAKNCRFPPAITALGLIYYDQGKIDLALDLIHEAATLNAAEALRILSISYELGIDGCPKDQCLATAFKDRLKEQPEYDVLIGYFPLCSSVERL